MKTTMRTILGLSAVALALATGGREAKADHVFQLVDVTFGSPFGGTATGMFTTNDALTALLTYDITTSSVAGYPGFEYTPATAPDVFNDLPNGFSLSESNRGPHFLVLTFRLTATGATIIFPSYEENTNALFPFMRNVASGSVVGVPEPSSLVLGGLAAAAGLGLWAWRRRAASRVG
jgi:hypothetical protein